MICIVALANTETAFPSVCCQEVQGMPQQPRLSDKRQWQLREAQRKRHQVSMLAILLCPACMNDLSIISVAGTALCCCK